MKHASNHSHKQGFTLIEMLVVVGVIVVISAVVLANNSRFGGTILLENFAYDIALSVRQAQVYGIATVRFSQTTFTASYGLHFDTSSNTSYILFADAVGAQNGVYDTGELVSTTNITRGFFLSSLHVNSCTDQTVVTKLDITYRRPEPDAYIHINGVGGAGASPYSFACIIVQSPRGDTMDIVIYSNGQITVQR